MPYYLYVEQNNSRGAKVKLCKCDIPSWKNNKFPEIKFTTWQCVGNEDAIPGTYTIWLDEEGMYKKDYDVNSIVHGLTLRWYEMWDFLPMGDAVVKIPLGCTEKKAREASQKILKVMWGLEEKLECEAKNIKVDPKAKPREQKEYDQWVSEIYSVAFDATPVSATTTATVTTSKGSDSESEEEEEEEDESDSGMNIDDVELENLSS